MNILVTGATGFIGSHTCVSLLEEGHNVIAFDNFYNSKESVIDNIKTLTGKDFTFYNTDLTDKSALQNIFDNHHFHILIQVAIVLGQLTYLHFALSIYSLVHIFAI